MLHRQGSMLINSEVHNVATNEAQEIRGVPEGKESHNEVKESGEGPPLLSDADGNAKLTVDLLQEQELETAQNDVPETLRNVFDSMATNGKITMDQLPFVLVGAEVQATAKEVEEAIEEHFPDADDPDALLDFLQVEALYQQLLHSVVEVLPLEAVQVLAAQKPALWRRGWAWVKARHHQRKLQATAYEKHMKPTMRLLLLILCTSCLISTAVVVFALIFIWDNSTNTVADHLIRDVELIRDGLNLFGYVHQFDTYDVNEARLAALLAVVVEDLGYQGTKRTMTANLQFQQSVMGKLLDGWFENDSLNTVTSTAVLVKSWVEQLMQVRSEATVVAMVNNLNPRMPAGHEILLGRWADSTQTAVRFLNEFRYEDQCLNGICQSDQSALSPMIGALMNQTGSMFVNDYRPSRVAAAYTFIDGTGIGLVYKVDVLTLQEDFVDPITTVINEINLKTTQSASAAAAAASDGIQANSQEVVLAKTTNGQTQILSALRSCDAKCMQVANVEGSVLTLALEGISGVNETTDFNGESIFTAYGPLNYSAMALVVKMATQELVDNLYVSLGAALDFVNTQLLETQEVQLASRKPNSTSSTQNDLQIHTAYKFPESCQGPCGSIPNTSIYMWNAINDCESGSMRALDYRGEMVTAGYACVPSLTAALVVKVDHAQIYDAGVAMAGTIAAFQNYNRYANKTTEVMVAKKKSGVLVVTTVNDYDQVTKLKYAQECANNVSCDGVTSQMILALQGQTGFMKGPDYRGVSTVGAYTYTDGLELGIIIKIDSAEAEAPSLLLTLQLCACTVSAVVVSMITLAFLANVLLKSMDRAWEEGKRAIEREKQQFRRVIEAMYPSQVAKRMLAGETQIVYNVGSATVFFSDIYEFTATSNAVTPEQLMQFMGYTFGTMDHLADHFHVYKVKTIGDAYLAVAGLPGSESLSGNTTLDMLLFASACAQVFSSRFIHPEEGAILSTIAKTVLAKKKIVKMEPGAEAQLPKRPSLITYGDSPANSPPDSSVPLVHCIMRYGVAAGPITAGVLQGKTPQFDIWGKTVNLASRMESTGQPGRIQVSEAVHQLVMANKGQPFVFEARHKTFCKGFGNVSAYFISGCSIAPPKELMTSMNIEPDLGRFYFDNPIPGFKAIVRGGAVKSNSNRGSVHESQSTRSSVVSGPNIRAEATLQT